MEFLGETVLVIGLACFVFGFLLGKYQADLRWRNNADEPYGIYSKNCIYHVKRTQEFGQKDEESA